MKSDFRPHYVVAHIMGNINISSNLWVIIFPYILTTKMNVGFYLYMLVMLCTK